jgi:hypothetical protein
VELRALCGSSDGAALIVGSVESTWPDRVGTPAASVWPEDDGEVGSVRRPLLLFVFRWRLEGSARVHRSALMQQMLERLVRFLHQRGGCRYPLMATYSERHLPCTHIVATCEHLFEANISLLEVSQRSIYAWTTGKYPGSKPSAHLATTAQNTGRTRSVHSSGTSKIVLCHARRSRCVCGRRDAGSGSSGGALAQGP